MTRAESIFYKVIEPGKHIRSGNPCVILLHGRGADENDLLELSPYLDKRLLIVSARAPFPFQYGPGYTWYDIEKIGKPDRDKFFRSLESIDWLLKEITTKYNIIADRIYLLGFSMGAVMAYATALLNPEKIAGVVAHSGYIAVDEEVNYKWDRISETKFFIAHGTEDPVIPVNFGREAERLLKEYNADYLYKEYPIGHHISQESLEDCTKWMDNLLPEFQ